MKLLAATGGCATHLRWIAFGRCLPSGPTSYSISVFVGSKAWIAKKH